MFGEGSRRRIRFALGFCTALAALFGAAELFLRLFPPSDLHPYLGENSPLTGNYRPDRSFGVSYRSFADFAAANAKRLEPWLPLEAPPDARPIWAMFGSSFVHMKGMLADTARRTVRDRAIFNLGRNEPVPVRMAQIQLLLEHGFRPERIFFQIMPLDFAGLAEQPLASYHVTARGALTYRPNVPDGPAGACILGSRLAFTAWCRLGLQKGDPFMSRSRLAVGLDEGVLRDARRLFAELAAATRQTPVTVILIPNYEHIWRKAPCGFQDALTPLLQELGYDVFDPREAFMRHPNRAELFIPDKHFSAEGNRLLLAELLVHERDASAKLKNKAAPMGGVPPARPHALALSGSESQGGGRSEGQEGAAAAKDGRKRGAR